MDRPRTYQLRVLRRRGGVEDVQIVCTPQQLMAEAHRLRRQPDAHEVEVLSDGEHLFALA